MQDPARVTAEVTVQHGSIIYVEIPVRDLRRAADFYAGLFGWIFDDREPDRWVFTPGGHGPMGAITTRRAAGPHGVHLAVAVDDVVGASERAFRLGGGPGASTRSELGTSREVVDPDGNHLFVFESSLTRRDVTRRPPVWHDD